MVNILLIESIIVSIFLQLYLQKRLDYQDWYCAAFGVISFCVRYALIYFVNNSILSLMIFVLFAGCYSYTFGRKNNYEQIVFTCLFVISIYLFDMIGLSIYATILDIAIVYVKNSVRYYWEAMFVSKCLYALFLIMILLMRKRIITYNNHSLEIVVVIFLVIVSEALLIGLLIYNEVTVLSILLIMISILGICVYMYIFMLRTKIAEKERMEAVVIAKELDSQKKLHDEMHKNHLEVRKIKHDMNHHLQIVLGLLQDDDIEEAKDTIHKISQSILLTNVYQYMNIPSLDYLLSSKIQEANIRKIVSKVMIEFDELHLNKQDLGVLLGNLLDNAIENCGNKKEIQITLKQINEYLMIIIANAIDDSILATNPNLQTTKDDSNAHGLGLKSSKDIVTKYEGILQFDEKEGFFIVKVILKNEPVIPQ
ncbi:MAG: GHKL domain-containing protein [Erysipelotrichaceae bacterium]|nr:GHKL domain-containing protein [Erysipelotrichaceae bacterium]